MTISVLYYPHREGHNSIFPLFAFRKGLADSGLKIIFYTSTDSFLASKADIWMVSGFSLPKLLQRKNLSIPEFLRHCHDRKVPLVYLSGSDSTGPFDQEVIRWVDLYLARQLVKDRSFYQSPHRRHWFRHRYFGDFRFKNEKEFPLINYTPDEIAKFGISWNLGLIDWKTQTSSKLVRYTHILLRNSDFPEWKAGLPLNQREHDLMFRGNLFGKSHDACRLHRLQTYRIYRKEAKLRKTVPEGTVSHSAYIKELSSSKICLSPFGWGEICYRDFESFQSRTLLFKPKMDHLDTFPDYYSSNAFIEYDWAGKDLSEKISLTLDNISAYQEIADQGWEQFQKLSKGPEAEFNFTMHLNNQLKNAIKSFSLR